MTQPTNPSSLNIDLELDTKEELTTEAQGNIALAVGEVFNNHGLTQGTIHIIFKEF